MQVPTKSRNPTVFSWGNPFHSYLTHSKFFFSISAFLKVTHIPKKPKKRGWIRYPVHFPSTWFTPSTTNSWIPGFSWDLHCTSFKKKTDVNDIFFVKSRSGARPRLPKPKNYNFWRIITHLQDTALLGSCPTQTNLPKPSIVRQSPPWIQHTNAKYGDYFSRKRLKSADFRSKIPTFCQKNQLTSGSGNATY